jgi:hypothetical protein
MNERWGFWYGAVLATLVVSITGLYVITRVYS